MGYHGKYNSPNMGRPQSDPKKRFFSKIIKTDDCWIWNGGLDRDGYGLFQLNKKQWRAHRFMMHITEGLSSLLPVVMHTCDNPLCVRPEHLKNSSIKKNNDDKKDKRRHRHLFTDAEIRDIRTNKLSRKQLALKYKCSRVSIHYILHKIYYSHIS